MKIERYVLEVAMPDDLQGQISAHQILKTIRQNVNQDDLLNGLSFDLTTPENILWIQNNQIKGNIPPQMLMSILHDAEGAEEKAPIGFLEAPAASVRKSKKQEKKAHV